MGNPEGPADFSEGFPGFPPCQGFEDLVAGQLELPAEPYAPGLGPLPSLRSPGLDQLPFKLSKATQDG